MKLPLSRFGVALAAALVSAALVRAAAPLVRAPAWQFKDLNGREVNSAQFRGKVVVLDFWATWCPPCVREIPGYMALQKKLQDDGLEIVGVALDETGAGTVRRYVNKNAVNYTVVMSSWEQISRFGTIDQIPTTIVIDRDGFIRARLVGYEPPAKFESLLKPLLDAPVSAPPASNQASTSR